MTNDNNKILLAHGGGGRLTGNLIEEIILPRFTNETLAQLTDGALIELESTKLCFTTDSFVVKPLVFAGGDIGKLAVCGTVNDLAVSGAKPVGLSLSLIIEEGMEFALLEQILDSAAQTAAKAGVPIVTGDTKVVESGAADGIYINTAGVGTMIDGVDLSVKRIAPGDKIIINGTIGDHGMTIMSQREGMSFDSPLKSDCAPLNDICKSVLTIGPGVKFMRDPTRGGVSATTNEIAKESGFSVRLSENDLPIDPTVKAAADMLGFDLLNIANEGKVVIVASPDATDAVLAKCKENKYGHKAAVIGEIIATEPAHEPIVEMVTNIGGSRIVQMPYGRELPRIC
jgi:hydrogenase expression/formation protein HypE